MTDLQAGQQYGRLVAVRPDGASKWVFRCICGIEKPINIYNVLRGTSRSCGCLRTEQLVSRRQTHGETRREHRTPEANALHGALQRCFNKRNPKYEDYGGRGIQVCARWRGPLGLKCFIEDMGRRPSHNHSLDRFPNNDGNYEKSNCRWATRTEQVQNRRTTVAADVTPMAFIVSVEMKEELADAAREDGLTVSSFVRQAVRAALLAVRMRRKYGAA